MSRPYWGQGRQRKYETDDLKIIFEVALRALRLWLLKALTLGATKTPIVIGISPGFIGLLFILLLIF